MRLDILITQANPSVGSCKTYSVSSILSSFAWTYSNLIGLLRSGRFVAFRVQSSDAPAKQPANPRHDMQYSRRWLTRPPRIVERLDRAYMHLQ